MNTVLTADAIKERLKRLDKKCNKGTSGTLNAVVGSERFRGAADLAVGAALRTGCGIVRLISVEKVISLAAVRHPSAVFLPVKENGDGMIAECARADIAETSKRATAFLVGPGLGQCADTAAVVSAVAAFSPKTVIDADALNIISQAPELLSAFKKPFIMTPHVGEMSRLTGLSVTEIKNDPASVASEFSRAYGCVTVLKDHVTYISAENGDIYESRLGNEGLAKGGSGDVLSGLIAGFLAGGASAEDAAVIGVTLHGLSADRCSAERGKRGMLPSELEEYAVKILNEMGY